MNKRKCILYLLISIFTLNSCVDRTFIECKDDLVFELVVSMTKYEFAEISKNVILYVYDQEGSYVNKYVFSKKDLIGNAHKLIVPRPSEDGVYSFLVLVNHDEDYYETYNSETLTTIRTRLLTDDNTTDKNLTDIYHGITHIELKSSQENYSHVIYLTKNTNNIDVTLNIQNYVPDINSVISTRLKGKNGTYDYKNQSVGNTHITYYPYSKDKTRAVEETFEDKFKTMRLRLGDGMKLYVDKEYTDLQPVTMNELNLIEIIASLEDPATGEKLYNTNEKLWQEDEFQIYLILDGNTFAVVEMKINGWSYNPIPIDL